MLKYKMTDEVMEYEGRQLHRIQAVRDFEYYYLHKDKGVVKKGQLGGWIEKESNLSHEGNCWICDEAIVYDDAEVKGSATVSSYSKVCGTVVIKDNAWISGHATINGHNSIIDGEAKICDKAAVEGNVRFNGVACGNCHIGKSAVVFGKVCGKANVDCVTVVDNSTIGEDAMVKSANDYKYIVNQGITVYRTSKNKIRVRGRNREYDVEYLKAVAGIDISSIIRIENRLDRADRVKIASSGNTSKKADRVLKSDIIEKDLLLALKSKPPEGHARWSARLLTEKMLEMGKVESLSEITVGRLLRKHNIELGISEKVKKQIIEMCANEPPAGHKRWTVKLIKQRAIELGIIGYISEMSITRLMDSEGMKMRWTVGTNSSIIQ